MRISQPDIATVEVDVSVPELTGAGTYGNDAPKETKFELRIANSELRRGRRLPFLTSEFAIRYSQLGGAVDGAPQLGMTFGYFAITPRKPPLIRAARFVRMRGRASPPGEARYVGSHSGSHFALYWRRPWKL